jgi:hypothetical protein
VKPIYSGGNGAKFANLNFECEGAMALVLEPSVSARVIFVDMCCVIEVIALLLSGICCHVSFVWQLSFLLQVVP